MAHLTVLWGNCQLCRRRAKGYALDMDALDRKMTEEKLELMRRNAAQTQRIVESMKLGVVIGGATQAMREGVSKIQMDDYRAMVRAANIVR